MSGEQEMFPRIGRGLTLIVGSFVCFLFMFLAGVALYMTSPATLGLPTLILAATLLALFALATGLVGKVLCLPTPVGKPYLVSALVCDGLGFVAALGDFNSAFFSFLSSVLFLGFVYKLGRFLDSGEIVKPARQALSSFFCGVQVMLLALWVSIITPESPAPMVAVACSLLLVGGLIWTLSGVVFYFRALQNASQVLGSREHSKAKTHAPVA